MSPGCKTLQSHECVPRRSEHDFPRRRRSPLLLLWAPKAVQGDTPPPFSCDRETLQDCRLETHVITHTAALEGVRFQNHQEGGGGSSGKKQRFPPQVMLLTEGFFFSPVLLVAPLHPPPSLHNAQSQTLIGAKFPCMMQPERRGKCPPPADNFIHLFLGTKNRELSYSSWSSVV